MSGISSRELGEREPGLPQAPVGLDLGARTTAETAVSIVAGVILARDGRAGAALGGTDGRIGW
jgi:xanthine dehydrogenase accessory factor